MPRRLHFFKTLKLYTRRQLQGFIQHTATGVGIAALFVHTIHYMEIFKAKEYLLVTIFIIVAILPVVIDFIFFYLRNSNALLARVGDLEHLVEKIGKSEHQFMKDSAISRVNKEIGVLQDMLANKLALPSLQNFEYIREILTRVLKNVMQPGDRYFTLSSLEFWITKPQQHDFAGVGLKAARIGQKYVDRIIVLDPHLYSKVQESENMYVKRRELENLVESFARESRDDTYFSPHLTLFYFADDYEDLRAYLLSVFVLNSRKSELMMLKVDGIVDLESENPRISVKYHPVEYAGKSRRREALKSDGIIDILVELKQSFVRQLTDNGSNSDYEQVIEYLGIYSTVFGKLDDIYSIQKDGKKRISQTTVRLYDACTLNEIFKKQKASSV